MGRQRSERHSFPETLEPMRERMMSNNYKAAGILEAPPAKMAFSSSARVLATTTRRRFHPLPPPPERCSFSLRFDDRNASSAHQISKLRLKTPTHCSWRRRVSESENEVESTSSSSHVSTEKSLIWEWAILVSPFFFWGTAMVAMKEVLPKAGPFFVPAFRLIPAGLLIIAYAASRGRKQPSGFSAWLSIFLFALVDATCFQV